MFRAEERDQLHVLPGREQVDCRRARAVATSVICYEANAFVDKNLRQTVRQAINPEPDVRLAIQATRGKE